MKKILPIALLLILGALAFMILTWPRPVETTTHSPASLPDRPSTPAPPKSVANPPPTPASTAPATAPAIPEELKDPRALDPEPLPLALNTLPFERQNDGRILKTDIARTADDLNNPNHDPVEDLQILDSIIGAYRTIFRQNPIAGENQEVVAALTGGNAYDLMFINPNHPSISESGELLDRWETPYRFHAYSGQFMEFISAGPDRQFGTPDDILIDDPLVIGPPEPEPGPDAEPKS